MEVRTRAKLVAFVLSVFVGVAIGKRLLCVLFWATAVGETCRFFAKPESCEVVPGTVFFPLTLRIGV